MSVPHPQDQNAAHRRPRDAAAAAWVDPNAAATPPVWPESPAPWGTPGNHLTGPIPRIRKRPDGTLDHGEES